MSQVAEGIGWLNIEPKPGSTNSEASFHINWIGHFLYLYILCGFGLSVEGVFTVPEMGRLAYFWRFYSVFSRTSNSALAIIIDIARPTKFHPYIPNTFRKFGPTTHLL